MADLSIIFQHVSFTHNRATQPLFQDLTLHFTKGWTGIVGANGVGKSTLLKLATGAFNPQKGKIVFPEFAVYCHQRTDTIPDHLHRLMDSMDGDAFEIRGRLGVENDWIGRWATLSHGERKRAQIAAALWQQPQVLAIDEPTNHLDAYAQGLLYDALSVFQGVGMLVSHDRKFLDDLCHECLFVEPPGAVMRPGNYTQGLLQTESDEYTISRQRSHAKQTLSRLKREATKRRTAASRANRKRSKRGIDGKDHDAKEKINLARVTGKDGADGKRLNQMAGRLSQARKKLDAFKVRKKYEMGIWMPGAKSKRNTLFNLASGSLPLGEDRVLFFPDISMKPDDRIALTGSNGSGKSTLIGAIVQSLNIPQDRVAYLPQEIDINKSKEIMDRARDLPNEKLGQMMTIVSRLGSRPHRLLDSVAPSPGEIRKILLATGIANRPHLIVMDEPTNHLDLPSIECLEQALADCPCGLLLVSHDRLFLNTLVHTQWRISEHNEIKDNFILEI